MVNYKPSLICNAGEAIVRQWQAAAQVNVSTASINQFDTMKRWNNVALEIAARLLLTATSGNWRLLWACEQINRCRSRNKSNDCNVCPCRRYPR